MITKERHDIDHKDRDGLNNKWDNIRNATRSQNLGNQTIYKNNKSGYKSVCWDKRANRWIVRIQVNKKSKILGYFINLDDGAKAYAEAATKYFGEFARTE